jgi:hypothetical protein
MGLLLIVILKVLVLLQMLRWMLLGLVQVLLEVDVLQGCSSCLLLCEPSVDKQ